VHHAESVNRSIAETRKFPHIPNRRHSLMPPTEWVALGYPMGNRNVFFFSSMNSCQQLLPPRQPKMTHLFRSRICSVKYLSCIKQYNT
jgi:hypothetical protein